MQKKWLMALLVPVSISCFLFVLSPKAEALVQMPSPLQIFSQIINTPREISHGNIFKKQVIFTFDGGGANVSGDQILAVLAKHHVKGTFFLTGKMVEDNPDFVKSIVAAGYEIFNHTYNHLGLTLLPNDKIGQELTGMETALQAVAGISSKPYFRAPYGLRNARVLATAAKYGYQSVYWTVDAMDWKTKGETPLQIKQRILSHLSPGDIYLMHVSDATTGLILDDVFTAIEARSYHIVSLMQGL